MSRPPSVVVSGGWGTPHRAPPPSAYVRSWLARGETSIVDDAEDGAHTPGCRTDGDVVNDGAGTFSSEVDGELFRLLLGDGPRSKTWSKELLGRTLPRLAAHGVPSLDALSPLASLLTGGSSSGSSTSHHHSPPDRYVVRYAYYFVQRLLSHYGECAVGKEEAPGAAHPVVSMLATESRERSGAHRQILATRALTAAARVGVPGAGAALEATLGATTERLASGKHGKKQKKMGVSLGGIFSGGGANGGTDSAARAAMGATRRMMTTGAWRHHGAREGRDGGEAAADGADPPRDDPASKKTAPSNPNASSKTLAAVAAAMTSVDAIAARHALSVALAMAVNATTGADFEAVALALAPGIEAAARDVDARAAAAAAAAAAATQTASGGQHPRGAATDVKPPPVMSRDKAAPNAASPAAQALLARLCGVLRARLLAAQGGAVAKGVAAACEKVLAASLRPAAAEGSKETGRAPFGGTSPRVVIAAAAAMVAADAAPGPEGASARSAAWVSLCRAGKNPVRDSDPPGLAAVARRLTEALTCRSRDAADRPTLGDPARAAACRAAAALGEARAVARAAGRPSAAGSAVEGRVVLPPLVAALAALADDRALVCGGVRVEAMRALLWLETPESANFLRAPDVIARQLGRGGEGLGDEWRGCDAPRRLLTTAVARCAAFRGENGAERGGSSPTVSSDSQAFPSAAESATWATMTLDAVLVIVAAAPSFAPPVDVVAALGEAQRLGATSAVLAATSALATAARGAGSDAAPLEAALMWHLGENANYNASEYGWTADDAAATVVDATATVDDVAAARNPPLATAIASLRRALLTSADWSVRAAAVQALATVAVRSGEPFRLQCYAALRAVQTADEADAAALARASLNQGTRNERRRDDDPFGAGHVAGDGRADGGADAARVPSVATPLADDVSRALTVLDHVYRAQERLAALTTRHGTAPEAWPMSALAEVAGRHAVLVERTGGVCFLPARMVVPMGKGSRVLVEAFEGARGGDVKAAAATAAKLMMQEEAAAAAAARGKRRPAARGEPEPGWSNAPGGGDGRSLI